MTIIPKADWPRRLGPAVTWGRWQEEGDRTILHLSLELNHRLLDGVHVGRFYAALNRWMEEELER